MYIGSTAPTTHEDAILVGLFQEVSGSPPVTLSMMRDATFSEGLLRIFKEPLANIVDHAWRSRQADGQTPLTAVVLALDADSGTFSCENDGAPVCVSTCTELDDEYVPAVMFGSLHSSTNYDDAEQRYSSGRNGMGVKLTNVFSRRFTVDIYNASERKSYQQTWTDNMRRPGRPIIKSLDKLKKTRPHNRLRLEFQPDLDRFGVHEPHAVYAPTATFFQVLLRHVQDLAMILGVPVKFHYTHDGQKRTASLTCRNVASYCTMVCPNMARKPLHLTVCKRQCPEFQFQLVLFPHTQAKDEPVVVSYVNGVDARADFAKPFLDDIWKRMIQEWTCPSSFRVRDVKALFGMVLVARVPNPTFDSQCKAQCTQPSLSRSDAELETGQGWSAAVGDVARQLCKWPHVQAFRKEWLEKMRVQEAMTTMRKTAPRSRLVQAEGYDAANWAGGRRSADCVLILCEGLSAKTFAVQGIKKGWGSRRGRDVFGIYPFRGKCLNVRNASAKAVSANREWSDLMDILNMEKNIDYTASAGFQRLRYGKVVLLTDADTDGVHIASLIINFFHVMNPSLLQRGQFLYWMRAPVARVWAPRVLTFYSEQKYRQFLEDCKGHHSVKSKFFKGLGTCSNDDIDASFGEHVLEMQFDAGAANALDECFSDRAVAQRRAQIQQFDPRAQTTEPTDQRYPISLFLRQEWIRFCVDDCERSIPHLLDGLKTSQRKILHAVLEKPVLHRNPAIKVAQLAGYVAELTHYHHGEQCLHDTICKMAQQFTGANFANLPLLTPEGQFGSRLYLGKDAASGRYIYTKGVPYLEALFPPADASVLQPRWEDGAQVEPCFYLPILPLILVNGCRTGIGTGWSCTIPPFEPLQLIAALDTHLSGGAWRMDWTPHYRGFTGMIDRLSDTAFKCTGRLTHASATDVWTVDEIPISTSIHRYKEFLDSLVATKCIDRLRNLSDTSKAHFTFVAVAPFQPTADTMKLTETIHLTNMVLQDATGRLRKLSSLDEVATMFVEERLRAYEKRREHLIAQTKRRMQEMSNKVKWVTWLLHKDHLLQYHKASLTTDLKALLAKAGVHTIDGPEAQSLVDISIRHLNAKRLDEWRTQVGALKAEGVRLARLTAQEMWRQELQALRAVLP